MMKMPASLMICSALLIAQQGHAESLLDIYQRALLSDPLLREAEATRFATLQAKPQALGALLPQVGANARYTDDESSGTTDSSFGGATVRQDFDDASDGWIWGVQLTQTLFRWDQWVALKQADKQVAQAEADYRAAGQDLMIRVAESYFNVLAAQDTLASEQAAKEAIGRQLEQAQKRFEVGLIAITDVQEAQAGYDQAVATEIGAKRALASAREGVREIIGEYTTDLAGPREQIPLVSPDPEDEDAWVETALQQNLSLLSSELGAQIAKDDVRRVRTGHYPTIDLVVTHTDTDVSGNTVRNNEPSLIGRDSEADSIQVQFALPIFSGGTTSAQVREAVYRHRAAKERFERSARETERQTRDSYLGVISEISRVKALRQALQSAQTALQATEAGFEVGTRTTVDVLDARRQLFIAETNYARSRYDYILNVLRLKQAAGTLTVDDLSEVDGWLAEDSAASGSGG
jgi:outer membrane protein